MRATNEVVGTGSQAAEQALGFAATDDEEIGLGDFDSGKDGVVDGVSGDDLDGFRNEGGVGNGGIFLAAILGLHLPFDIGETAGEAKGG